MRHSRGGMGVHGGGRERPPAPESGADERKAEDECDGQTGPSRAMVESWDCP